MNSRRLPLGMVLIAVTLMNGAAEQPRDPQQERDIEQLREKRRLNATQLEKLLPDSLEQIAQSLSFTELVDLMHSSPILQDRLKGEFEKRKLIGYWKTGQIESKVLQRSYFESQLVRLAPVTTVAFSPDGKLLAVIYGKTVARLWDVDSGKNIRDFKGDTGAVKAVAFSPDGKLLAASHDARVALWDAASFKLIRVLKGHTGDVHSVAFSPDGKLLATMEFGGICTLWDLETGQVKKISIEDSDLGKWVAFSPVGNLLAIVTSHNFKLWDVGSNKVTRTFKSNQSDIVEALARKSYFESAIFSPDGKILALCLANGVLLLDAKTGSITNVFKVEDIILAIAFSPDGKILAGAAGDQTIKLWNVTTGNEINVLKGPTYADAIAFSPDGRLLASGFKDSTVRLWYRKKKIEKSSSWWWPF